MHGWWQPLPIRLEARVWAVPVGGRLQLPPGAYGNDRSRYTKIDTMLDILRLTTTGLTAQASCEQKAFEQVVMEQYEGSDQQVRGKSCLA